MEVNDESDIYHSEKKDDNEEKDEGEGSNRRCLVLLKISARRWERLRYKLKFMGKITILTFMGLGRRRMLMGQ